ncbi:MAG: hypothetical protein AAFV71_22380 [Cyanobacteria bacterium J06633_8]
MTLTRFNSRSAIWFDDNCYGVVVCKSIDGKLLWKSGNKSFSLKNLEIVHANTGLLSEKEILDNLTRLSGEYRDVLNLACNNSLMVETIKLPLLDSYFKEFNNSTEAITKMKTLLTDERIMMPDELKPLFRSEFDVYDSTENQTPLVSALLMCLLQVKEFFQQIYLDVLRPKRYF